MKPHAKHALREFRAPDEAGAERRAWSVVHAAYLERRAGTRRGAEAPPARARRAVLARDHRRPGALARRRDRRTADHPGPRRPPGGPDAVIAALRRADPSLRAGRNVDRRRRRLDPPPGRLAADASWSPRGLYVAVASGDRLAAVDPRGNVRWAIARPDVSDPRWFSPTGYRVAYLSAGTLRVIAGDGTDDRLLAARVARRRARRGGPITRSSSPTSPLAAA